MSKFLAMTTRALALVLMFSVAATVFAQSYPTKPVRWIVPVAPGGIYDVVTRAVAPHLQANLGQPFLVENRASAGGITGLEFVAKAPADGYTILFAAHSQLVFNKYVYSKLPYDPQRDFAPITMMLKFPQALFLNTAVPARSLQELVVYAKANPGTLNYGSAGIGHAWHLGTEMFMQHTGTKMVHVPYKGFAPALQDLLAGRIQLLFYPPSTQMLAFISAGKLRALAATTEKRLGELPDVPTFDELGVPNMQDIGGWAATVAPAGTPRPIIDRLNKEIVTTLALPEFAALYSKLAVLPGTTTPDEMSRILAQYHETWGPLIRKLDIKEE
jgi:tripartite-type tricarboxylate transporter receptor subunit TctC